MGLRESDAPRSAVGDRRRGFCQSIAREGKTGKHYPGGNSNDQPAPERRIQSRQSRRTRTPDTTGLGFTEGRRGELLSAPTVRRRTSSPGIAWWQGRAELHQSDRRAGRDELKVPTAVQCRSPSLTDRSHRADVHTTGECITRCMSLTREAWTHDLRPHRRVTVPSHAP